MADSKTAGFFSQHGAALIDAGYNIIPIQPGKKAPGFDDWEKLRLTKSEHGKLAANGHAKDGVGILTKHTPGVDLDIRDKALAVEMEEWCHANIGVAPVRVGMPPKRLLLYRAPEPFRKVTSKTYIDDIGVDHKVEILGDGQQFVAYHIHPDTRKPFEWLYLDGPLITEAGDLPTITEAQARAVAAEFERRATELGWTPKKSASRLSQGLAKVDKDDPFAADVSKVTIDEDDLRAKLGRVPGADDYDTWLQIGMALYHQFDGGEKGRSWWHEWSEPAANYDADSLDRKWDTFNITEKGRAPVTARLIIKLAGQEDREQLAAAVDEVRQEMMQAETMPVLREVCKRAKVIDFDGADREMIVGVLKSAFKRITNQSLGIKVARDMVRFEAPKPETPKWLRDWLYMTRDDAFYNSRTLDIMSKDAFNNSYSRFLLTPQQIAEGQSVPDELPHQVALNRFQIRTVRSRMYLPGQDDVFTMNGAAYVNMYSESSQPAVPEKFSAEDKRNVGLVDDHFAHLIPDERDREIFKDYLAYVVQTSSRPNWAILLQGVESDGKSFFATIMGAVLGAENVRVLDAKNIEEQYNGWAEGQLLGFVEEVKMHGHNRFDILNRIKPLITNPVISIRRMRTDVYNVPNTTAWILFTNFRDALPLIENDSRFFVMFSRFQTRASIQDFNRRQPNYYTQLFAAVTESAGAIRKWFLGRKISESFDPDARAPDSRSKTYMIQMNKSEEAQTIDHLVSTSLRWDISTTLLNATDLIDLMMGEDCEIPHTRSIAKMLSDSGYTFLGRVKIAGKYSRFWSQEPERFNDNGAVSTDLIRAWISTDL